MEENKNKEPKKEIFRLLPQTPKRIKQNILLALGLIFIIVGIILTACNYSSVESANLKPSVITILAGAMFLFLGMGIIQSSFVIFCGLMIFLIGIPMLLNALEIVHISVLRMLPYSMICAGTSLFLTGVYKFRKVKASFFFPSVLLIVLGVFLLLFALGILRFSLATFVSRWLPLLILVVGVGLVAVFYVQRIMKKDFPYFDEEKDDVLDEESDAKHSDEKSGAKE